MLWKKESRQPDALYIDFFKPNTQHFDSILDSKFQAIEQTPHPKKSDAIALKKRKEGNEMFRDSALLKAMELYSDSLRFAQPGSEHISLAYANRATCFLKMKMYDECLIDIGYAIAAGYPTHLRPKLDDRKTKCLREMQEDLQYPREKFNIEPNEMFPSLSTMANVQRNENGDYSVVAAADIDIGQVISIEDAYHGYVTRCFGIYCNICAREFRNLVPCEKCAVAMFCPECQGHSLHEYECGLNFCGESDVNTSVMSSVRGLLSIFKGFSTADQLMVFVEDLLKQPKQLPEHLLDDRSKFQAFFNSPIKYHIVDSLNDEVVSFIYSMYKTLLRISYVNEMFATSKHRRFLMHLIGHYAKFFRSTAGTTLSVDCSNTLNPPVYISPVMHSYIKHSCYPNIVFVIVGGKSVTYSIRSIKKGEQLFGSYAPSGLSSTNVRKKLLWDMFKINCECSRCQGKVASPAQREQMVSDLAFRYMYANMESFQQRTLNIKRVESLMEACASVLQKYGQMEWCDDIFHVIKWFKTLYQIQLFGGGADFNHPLARELLSLCRHEMKRSNQK